MEISYLDKQEGYENSAPQRTGRQGRGLERADGHQDTPLDGFTSLDRACLARSSCASSFPLLPKTCSLQDLAEKNAEIKDKSDIQDRHGNSSQVSLF
ncbi:unnamed protein product [Microthlaspi erraticum]|uniref:Uncharacterized protein n=1 Tax=Microthlaspi erraticum TaxID=1685480 RepID=A0A6D2KFL6_9BRAS|nr:unnamed protein product [Microthlaspi erraticum]